MLILRIVWCIQQLASKQGESKNWLPYYYGTFILLTLNLMINQENPPNFMANSKTQNFPQKNFLLSLFSGKSFWLIATTIQQLYNQCVFYPKLNLIFNAIYKKAMITQLRETNINWQQDIFLWNTKSHKGQICHKS